MTNKQNKTGNTQQHRAAFTLFEMLIVLGLLLVLVSVVWPAVMRISAGNRLRQSMQDVNSAFAAARIRAIEDGVNYQVFLEPGGNHYLVVPVDRGILGLETDASDSQQSSLREPVISQELSEEFQFSKDFSATVKEPAVPFEWLAKLPNAKEWNWMESSFPITFYPDGTAAFDLKHEILKEDQQVAGIHLRSLTGSTTISYDQEKSK
ncbi:MAG: prepilin-type N-terminal cleavage/methylation domain-containing protein [Planctomycetes bacterium]|nr:prepilin-type N-terminal cleavage/methylation domain-containing protein [Planctomycetota bacterium]MCH9724878.1 prepilin-type N-terminal cleavage/methylation domain-containing protein [Planctomycetota bacterium]MCH9776837.1 prepilin-type N-terminal cleavage/methylation domain-containing protein [Planctomycetota bacterium]MCH9791151.1 prepilin-type N-terminal cleavage/methylation domain-containing protein [Planctomycetota bacterium]